MCRPGCTDSTRPTSSRGSATTPTAWSGPWRGSAPSPTRVPKVCEPRPYYEALRAAVELCFVAEWRLSDAAGDHDLPRPSWDVIADELIRFVRDRTGVTMTLPDAAPTVR